MASSTLSASTLFVPKASSLSGSSSAFLKSASPLAVAPLKRRVLPLNAAVVSANCSHAENNVVSNSAARRQFVAGVFAAAAAVAVFSSTAPVQAADGPGSSGAERTAQKAADILKAADRLNKEDAPQRYGPAVSEGAEKISQQAGSGAVPELQEGASAAAESAKETLTP